MIGQYYATATNHGPKNWEIRCYSITQKEPLIVFWFDKFTKAEAQKEGYKQFLQWISKNTENPGKFETH